MMDEIWFFENDKKRRKGILNICLICDKVFICPFKNPYQCCGNKCKYLLKSLTQTVEVSCAACLKIFRKKHSSLELSRSRLYFCSRKCKDDSQRIGGIKAIMPPHYGNGDGIHITRRLRNRDNFECSCGEIRKYLLCVHHVDGDRSNNVIDNLEVVCFNCHAKRHLKNINGKWVYNNNYLTPRDLLDTL